MTFPDNPDFMSAVATAQQKLADVASPGISAIVALPANCETVMVYAKNGGSITINTVVGTTTGTTYPFTAFPSGSSGPAFALWTIAVAPSLDPSIHIIIAGGSGSSWAVISDQGIRQVIDTVLATTVRFNGAASSGPGVPILGSDGSFWRDLLTDTFGRLFTMPGAATTLATGTFANGAQVLGAPGSGSYYITKVQALAAASDRGRMASTPGDIYFNVNPGPTLTPTDFDTPIQVTSALTWTPATVNQSATIIVTGFAGP